MIQGTTVPSYLNYAANSPNNGGAQIWSTTDIDAQFVAQFGYNCLPTWGGEDGYYWSTQGPGGVNGCQWTRNGITAEWYHTPRPRRPRDQQRWYNIYPLSASGNQALMGDGSVRNITTTVDVVAWSAAVTPDGGEVAALN